MKTSESKRAYFKKHYRENKAYYAALSKKWWSEHPDKLRAKWRRKSKSPKGRERAKKYREKNLDKVRRSRRVWQSKRWAHRQNYMRGYYLRNKDKIKSRVLELYNSHPERWLGYGARRRALKIGSATDNGAVERFIKNTRKRLFCVCYYCESGVSPFNVHFDHVIPLAKGGSHTVGNICTACADCNLSKNDKMPSRWNKLHQLFLDL